MKKKYVFVACMNSENYDWYALGETQEEAEKAILKAWNSHQRAVKKHDKTFTTTYFKTFDDLNDWYGVSVIALRPGECKFE